MDNKQLQHLHLSTIQNNNIQSTLPQSAEYHFMSCVLNNSTVKTTAVVSTFTTREHHVFIEIPIKDFQQTFFIGEAC